MLDMSVRTGSGVSEQLLRIKIIQKNKELNFIPVRLQ